jgi:superfamily I DNA/RNA helicase
MFDDIIKSTSPKICVIAAPGCGKTKRILIPKAHQILQKTSVNPREVLILTFSRLSAIDLRRQVRALQRAPRAATVHSLCLAFLLSEDSHQMRKRVESILLDFEKGALIADLKLVFPQERVQDLRRTLSKFSAGWATTPHEQVFADTDERRRFKAAVLNWLSEHESAMMEEIVYGAVELADHLNSSSFIEEPQFIFVDEYQDLNTLEQKFIDQLAAKSKTLLIVGDPDQSIYSFKYSHPSGIEDFARTDGVETYRSHVTGRCAKKIVEIANQLLVQATPGRTELLQSESDHDGEVNFVLRDSQEEEFEYLLRSLSVRIAGGVEPKEILVLVPRKKLGQEFVAYANARRNQAGLSAAVNFVFSGKPEFTETEQERILLFGLAVKPSSLLHARAFIGLGDANWRAKGLAALKRRYGNLFEALKSGKESDFSKGQKSARMACKRVEELREAVQSVTGHSEVTPLLEKLFPSGNPETAELRKILDELSEEDDTPASLYAKFIDYIRTVPTSDTTVRIMTLMGSKGLDADHVYILGCNGGNIPGPNLSHISDHEHKQEQRRLLYVGFTRARKSLTVSWARYLPFGQSRQHGTGGIRTIRRNGAVCEVMGLSEFLQDLRNVKWE